MRGPSGLRARTLAVQPRACRDKRTSRLRDLPECVRQREFVFTADIATDLKDGETIYFPVVQQCERGVNRWIDIPTGPAAAGGHGHGGEGAQPAPGLKLLPRR